MNDNNINILTAYSFLAALIENNNDLYNKVYVPICKRALSYYNKEFGNKSGTWTDIRDIILNEYGINVPQVIVKQLIYSTYKDLSINQRIKTGFKVFKNGEAFQAEKYIFSDLEEKYEKGKREANALQEAFEIYLQDVNLSADGIPSFHEFIDKNKQLVAAFFSNVEIKHTVNKSFYNHFEFLKKIEAYNHDLYKIAENQYIGSLLAGYFEAGLSLDPKFSSNEVYYLDTSIILRVLNLQKEEDTEAVKELLNLIKSTGGIIKVLSITIVEIINVIENAIKYYDNSYPTTTINEACLRLGKKRAWLMSTVANIENIIKEEIGINIEVLLPSFIEKYKNCNDVRELQSTRTRTSKNALHDVLSYMNVRQLRGNSIHTYQKAKIWFLTTNDELLKFNKRHIYGNIPEIVTADSLTGLLWLKNPSKLVDSIKKAGLNILLSTTFNEEFASKELISEFNSVIQSVDGVSENEYRELLASVAHQSAKNLNSFVELVKSDKEKAKIEIFKIIENERTRKYRDTKEIVDSKLLLRNKSEENLELNDKLSEIESRYSEMEKKISEMSEKTKDLNAKDKIKEKRTKRIIISLIIIIVFLLLIIINIKFSFFPKFINWLMGSGGLFASGNFFINLINLLRKK